MKFQLRLLLLIFLEASISCNSEKKHFSELLRNVDTVKIQYFTNKDTFFVLATSKENIDILKNIITGKQENIPVNEKTGRILFYSNGNLILEADQFNTVIVYSTNNTIYKERITYQAGMYSTFTEEKQNLHHIDSSNILRVKKKVVFYKNEPFQIINSIRAITNESSAKDTNDCKGWTLSKKALEKIIRNSKNISGTEWDLSFGVLPCIMKGQLKQNGNLFEFEMNGGSWFYLKSPDTTLIFGDYKKEDEKYFIVKPSEE